MSDLLLALHLLGAVLWVGGMAFALLVLRPAAHEVLQAPERLALAQAAFRRFFLIVWHAMPIVLLTGWALFFLWHGGWSGARWSLHLMHLLGLIMALVFLALFFGPWGAMRRAMAAGDIRRTAGDGGAAAARGAGRAGARERDARRRSR